MITPGRGFDTCHCQMLCPLTPLLDKNHTQGVTEVVIQCVPEDHAREGRMSSAVSREQGRDRGAWDQGKRAGAYLHTSRVPDQNRPMKSGLISMTTTMTTGYNKMTAEQPFCENVAEGIQTAKSNIKI